MEPQWLANIQRHDCEGIIVIDAESHIVEANPEGREYLALLADVGVGDTLTHLRECPLEEILDPPPEEMGHEIVLGSSPGRVFEVVAQPELTASRGDGWVLIIRDVTKAAEWPNSNQQPERIVSVVHWPPASPATSNLC